MVDGFYELIQMVECGSDWALKPIGRYGWNLRKVITVSSIIIDTAPMAASNWIMKV
jgi:hypothetical protein